MNPFRPVAAWFASRTWLARFLPQIVASDKLIHKLTFGRFTAMDFTGLPNVYLTVVGRKSGLPRTNPLMCVPHEGGWLVAGSYFGLPKTPLWVANLRAGGAASVQWKHRQFPVHVREVVAPEHEAVWALMERAWPPYARYAAAAAATGKTIPVFALTRKDPS